MIKGFSHVLLLLENGVIHAIQILTKGVKVKMAAIFDDGALIN